MAKICAYPRTVPGKDTEQMLLAAGAGLPREITEAARDAGMDTVTLPPFPMLPSPVAAHADLLIHPLGEVIYTFRDYFRIAEREIGLICRASGAVTEFMTAVPGDRYPADVPLCAKRVGNSFIANPRTAAELCRRAAVNGLALIPVNQGYAACSTALAGDGVITADAGIAKAVRRAGIPVLEIRPGHIDLPGYDYGFIGGACGFCAARGEVWFTGDPMTHPDGRAILEFIHARGLVAVSPRKGRLFDCGGMFFF